MRRIRTLVVMLCLGLLTAGIAHADAYTIDASHSQIMFKVKHLGITNVNGRFETFSGNFQYDPNNIENSSVEVNIDVASINTDVEDRDNHLRSADFFEVEKHPQMTFKSTKLQNVDGDSFELVGDLTLHGVTKQVVLEAELTGMATDPWGNEKVAFEAETTINRKDFGLEWNKVLETGGLVVGNEVRILLEVQGNKVKG